MKCVVLAYHSMGCAAIGELINAGFEISAVFTHRDKPGENIWFDSVCDLKWKLEECKKMHNIWGSFVAGWFGGFFTMDRFALGRFQYEKVHLRETYTWGDYTVTPEETVLNFHIPSCGPLTDERRMDSYARAAEFYRDLFPADKPVVLTCSSWLLFPAHKEMLPPSSRIVAFINDFDPIRSWDDPDYHDFWRVFYREYKDNPDEMPSETALQRAYLERRRAGLPAGGGQGVILYKDGKIINKK